MKNTIFITMFMTCVFMLTAAMSFEGNTVKDDIFMTTLNGPDSLVIGQASAFSFVGKYQREQVGSQTVGTKCNLYGPNSELLTTIETDYIVSQDALVGGCGFSSIFYTEPGIYTFEMIADYDNLIFEEKENNNKLSKTISVTE